MPVTKQCNCKVWGVYVLTRERERKYSRGEFTRDISVRACALAQTGRVHRPCRRGVFAEGGRFFCGVGVVFQVAATRQRPCVLPLGAASESGSHKLVRVKTAGKVDATSATAAASAGSIGSASFVEKGRNGTRRERERG